MSGDTGKSFYEVTRSFNAAIASAYQLAPCGVVVAAALMVAVTWIALLSAKLMVGTVLLVVLVVAVIVYATTTNYGEAALALVAGLLTVFSVTWTTQRFIAFMVAWCGFSFAALIIASIRIASRSESIYRQAALAYADKPEDSMVIEKQLIEIGGTSEAEGLGPIERAHAIRLFCFRKLPLEAQPAALKGVAMLSVITQIDSNAIASFVTDVFKAFNFAGSGMYDRIIDIVYLHLRQSAVPPQDFIKGFENSRRLLLGNEVAPLKYFRSLQDALELGIPPEQIVDHLGPKLTN